MARPLSLKQEAFVSAYIGSANGNATEAARKAGYHLPESSGKDNVRNPTIAAAIAERKAEIRAEGIANRQNRIDAQNVRWLALQQIVAERAAAWADDKEPGRSTGYVLRTIKGIGRGEDFQVVEEYTVDDHILSEFRELEQHTATEQGQWTEKRELTGKDGEALIQIIEVAAIAYDPPPVSDDD